MRFALVSVLVCACGTPRRAEPVAEHRPAPQAAAAVEAPVTGQRVDAAMEAIRARLAAKQITGMQLRLEDPFIVVADGGDAALERGAETVRWAVELLEADFFDARPAKLLPVFLFRDASSYTRGVTQLTGDEPGTPYGFYSRTHEGLFMNIATGGGTLVHEIVHPYVEADFPDAPAWLNEGLGSLFEQSAERDGRIVGLTNWRLAGLQQAIKRDVVPAFATLTGLDDNEFYGDDSGINYAAARYLLYYLQEQGKLRELYTTYRKNAATDPSGYKTLTATLAQLGEHDMAVFEARWKKYVAALTFP